MLHVQYISIDHFLITTTLKKNFNKTKHSPSGEPCASLGANCRFAAEPFAWLNDCANGDEVDFTFVQTQKTQSLYYVFAEGMTSLCLSVVKNTLYFVS